MSPGRSAALQSNDSINESTNHGHVNQEIFKKIPHMRTAVDLLHLNLCINVAMIQEIDVGCLHLCDYIVNLYNDDEDGDNNGDSDDDEDDDDR